jgi:hypothetical protein
MTKKLPVEFESLEDLQDYVKKIRPLTEQEKAFQKVRLRNPIVARMLAYGASLEEIIVALDKENDRLMLHLYLKS